MPISRTALSPRDGSITWPPLTTRSYSGVLAANAPETREIFSTIVLKYSNWRRFISGHCTLDFADRDPAGASRSDSRPALYLPGMGIDTALPAPRSAIQMVLPAGSTAVGVFNPSLITVTLALSPS